MDEKTGNQTNYLSMVQGKPIHALMQTSERSFTLDTITGHGIAVKNQVLIDIEDLITHKLNANALKVLLLTLTKLTKKASYGKEMTDAEVEENRAIEFTLKEYMELCGVCDKKTARDSLWNGIDTLLHTTLTWKETFPHLTGQTVVSYSYAGHVFEDRIAIEHLDRKNVIRNGKVYVHVGRILTKYLLGAYIMPLSMRLLAVNSHSNPHSLYLGYKLLLHYNLNINKTNATRIAVKTLLAACPSLPQEVKQRQEKQLIIEPFERDLDALTDESYKILSEWTYLDAKGKKLSDKELKELSYGKWINCSIEFHLVDYPAYQVKEAKEKQKKLPSSKAKGKKKNSETKEHPLPERKTDFYDPLGLAEKN